MPRKAVGGRAVTEQMGAASAALMELNDHWIAYLGWRKGEAENRLRATGDLDDALAGVSGSAPPAAAAGPEGGAGGLSPWAVGLGSAATGGDQTAWDLSAAEDAPAGDATDDRAGLWAGWAAAGEPDAEEAEAPR
jgi:hypothetical protein